MRRGLSRRNLVTGTAWAAPLVLSTAVIPAYASSSADDGPCLDPDKSYDIFAKDVRTAAQNRAAGEKGYEEIVVPDYASYMRFYLRGGSGGSLATRYSEATGYNRIGGTAGGGGNFVSPDILNPYVNAEGGAEWRGEIRDGAITYSFCPSDPNKQPDPPSPESPEYWA